MIFNIIFSFKTREQSINPMKKGLNVVKENAFVSKHFQHSVHAIIKHSNAQVNGNDKKKFSKRNLVNVFKTSFFCFYYQI